MKQSFQSYILFISIIRNWYPEAAPAIFKILDKIRPPKRNSTQHEEYLKLPEDDDDENFPIGVSDDNSEEPDKGGTTLPGSDTDESSENGDLDENESDSDSLEAELESIEGNLIKSQEFASGEKSDD